MDRARFSRFLVILLVLSMVSGCGGQKSVSTATATIVPTNTAIPTQTTIPTVAPTPTLSPEAQLASQIDGYVADLTEKGQFSGSILVGREGKVLISKGYGMANLEHNVPNTPHTKFRLASVTKQFTAMAILMLQQEGKLNVQDPICLYIYYDCPEAWQPITIHHLLTHTSGIHEMFDTAGFEDFIKKSVDPNTIIDQFRDLPLDFAPGESWSYSNSGYILLGSIIERASNYPYSLFIQLKIFEPLGMMNSGYDSNRTVIPNRAQGYFNSTTNSDYIDMSVSYAAGGLYSTVEDMFLWDQALYTDKLVSQSLRDEMFTPFAQIPDSTDGYGYGWYIWQFNNQQVFSHAGGIEGFVTNIRRFPESKVVIIVLSNFETADVNAISIKIGGMIFGEE